ncbi:MAG: O-antigen ligase family protein [Anaerolineae bacterium]
MSGLVTGLRAGAERNPPLRLWLTRHPAAVVIPAAAIGGGVLLGAAAAVLPPLLTVAALAGAVGLVVAAAWPELALLAIVAITIGFVDTDRLPLLGLGPVSLHLTDLILMALLVLTVLRVVGDRRGRVVRTPLDLPLIGFYGAVVLSAMLGIFFWGTDRSFVLRLVRPLTYYLAFFAVTNLIRDEKQWLRLAKGLLLLGSLAAAAVLLQSVVPSVHLLKTNTVGLVTVEESYQGVTRIYTQAERLMYPMLLVALSAVALRARLVPAVIEAARVAVLAIGLFLTFQRNYWATMAAMAVLLLVVVPGRARRALLQWGVLVLVAAAIVFSLPVARISAYRQAAFDRVIRGLAPEQLSRDSSTQWRVMETRYGLQSIAQRPILGVGVGGFYRPAVADDYVITGVPGSIGLRWYMHNTYLWVWTTMGLVGLLPFMALYGLAVARGMLLWRRMRDPQLQAFTLGITLGIFGQGLSNIVAPNFVQSWTLVVFAVMLGMNELAYRWSSATDAAPVPRLSRTGGRRVGG